MPVKVYKDSVNSITKKAQDLIGAMMKINKCKKWLKNMVKIGDL